MNLKLTQNKAITTGTQGLSAVSGAMVSKGAMGYAPAPMKTAPVKLFIGLGAFALASAITGSGTLVDILKGMSVGVGIQQTGSAVADFVAPTVSKLTEGKTKDFLVAATSGMAGVANQTINLPSHVWDSEPQAQNVRLGVTSVI